MSQFHESRDWDAISFVENVEIMKPTHRRITVNKRRYFWTIRRKRKLHKHGRDHDHVHVAIWSAECAGQTVNLQLRFDNPWLYFGEIITCQNPRKLADAFEFRPVTPKEISELIPVAIEAGWTPDKPNAQLHFFVNRSANTLHRVTQAEYDGIESNPSVSCDST
jgi:hypothetical protein